ncbi:protein-disulfide reductase DsbD family protein [Shewanella zhangzhouensis]|uniref:protein-disulfide reductase DsbD family protein n=1 Tax=Shewanella zhangzhouensis TaxID=2864213 RepID=UPI001C65B9CB|nr:protein-disulfide reductase DsbD domain-containing protein [Shewanella zhangzhouensis]QYK04370.1 thioredoxin family protein [Shewanella zhangzhouensis]
MKIITFGLKLIACCWLMTAAAITAPAGDDTGHKIRASLQLESSAPVAGTDTGLAIKMSPEAGWHGYWLNPGDAGFPLQAQWLLPNGVTVGELQYPAPEPMVISDLMNYIYHGDYALLAPLSISEDIAPGTALTLAVDIRYLVCSPKLCVPEQQRLETQFTVADKGTSSAPLEAFSDWRRAIPKPVATMADFSIQNGQLMLSLPFPESVPLTKTLHFYPEVNGPIANTAPQSFVRNGDRLFMQTGAGEAGVSDFYGVLTLDDAQAIRVKAVQVSGDALVFPTGAGLPGAEPDNLLVMSLVTVLGAILGGLLLNLMPCVFPILSLKVLSLANLGDERVARAGALAYTLGAVLVCVLLGGLILLLREFGHQVGWAFQLQRPEIIVVLILLMMAIALNLAGLFELGTLSSGSRLQQKQGVAGDFWTGVLAAFVATPCTGPFMATALGAALVLPTSVGLMVFTGLGLGMALPFLLVGFMPALRKRMPRPGAWMVTAKRCFSVPMFLTALGLVWVLMQQADSQYVFVALLLVLLLSLVLWLMGLFLQGGRDRPWWPLLVVLVVITGTLMTASPGSRSHEPLQAEVAEHGARLPLPFDEDVLTTLISERDMFVYFSADWCLTCKLNEKTAIERQETQAAFARANMAVMLGDWTNGDPDITRFLAKHQRSGVPLYLWYRKGNLQPQVLPQLLTPAILIDKASRAGDAVVAHGAQG